MPRQRPTRIRKAVEQAGEEPQAETATAVAGTATVANLTAGDSEGSDPTSKNELTENQQQMADTIAAMSGRYAASDVGGGIASELLPTIGGTVDSVIPGRASPSLDVFQANVREAIEESNQPFGPETPSLLDLSGGRLPAPAGFEPAADLRPWGGGTPQTGMSDPRDSQDGISTVFRVNSDVPARIVPNSENLRNRQEARDLLAQVEANEAARATAAAHAGTTLVRATEAAEKARAAKAAADQAQAEAEQAQAEADDAANAAAAEAAKNEPSNPGPDGDGATMAQRIAFREYFIGIAGGYDGRGGQRGGNIDPDENAPIMGTPTGSPDGGKGLTGDPDYESSVPGNLSTGDIKTPDPGTIDPNDDQVQMSGELGQYLDVQTDREEDLSRLFNDDDESSGTPRWSTSTTTKATIVDSDDDRRGGDVDD